MTATIPPIPQSPALSIPPSPQSSEPRTHNSRKRPRLTPISLLDHLQQNPNATLNTLTAHFHCSLDKLSQLLNNPEFLMRHKLQTQLAFLQSRLAAHNSLPGALAKTITLMNESEKPEVARRAAAALIQIAGLPIRTAAQLPPAPLPEPPPPAPPEPKPQFSDKELHQAWNSMAFISDLKDTDGINLDRIRAEHGSAFIQHILQFFDAHNIPYDKSRYTP